MRNVVLGQAAMVAICAIFSLTMAGRLPQNVPIHWDIRGQVDGWGSPAFALWFGPVTTLFLLVLTFAMPSLPGGKNAIRSGPAYGNTLLLVSGLMTFMHFSILRASAAGPIPGGDSTMTSTMMGGMFLFFAALGSQFGNIKPNPYVGLRTPWTLRSERVWKESHRRAGLIYIAGGLVGAALCFLGAPMGMAITLLVILCLAPIADSFLLSKRMA